MTTPVIRRRKKPVEVDTIQWTGDNEADVQAFTGGAGKFYALDAEDREGSDDPEATASVFDKLHSTWVLVYTGQHIVRGVKGEFYPIAEDVLAETYDESTDQTAAEAGVIDLYERWIKAGPPPLGTLMARWWDRRLAELHTAIRPPEQQPDARRLADGCECGGTVPHPDCPVHSPTDEAQPC